MAEDLIPIAVGESSAARFDPGSAAPFVEKSLSEHTRRAYRLAVAEFFRHSGMKHPSAVTPADVINRRDEASSAWDDAVYNLTRPVKTLRLEVNDENRRFQPLSPAMAAGLTDHLWTIKELLMTVVSPSKSTRSE